MKKYVRKSFPYAYRAIRALARRDELTVHKVTVPAWELPLVQANFAEVVIEDDNVSIPRKHEATAEDEFNRLEQKYRFVTEGGDPGVPLVARVYGQHAAGLRALQNEINEAKLSVEPADFAEVEQATEGYGPEYAEPEQEAEEDLSSLLQAG